MIPFATLAGDVRSRWSSCLPPARRALIACATGASFCWRAPPPASRELSVRPRSGAILGGSRAVLTEVVARPCGSATASSFFRAVRRLHVDSDELRFDHDNRTRAPPFTFRCFPPHRFAPGSLPRACRSRRHFLKSLKVRPELTWGPGTGSRWLRSKRWRRWPFRIVSAGGSTCPAQHAQTEEVNPVRRRARSMMEGNPPTSRRTPAYAWIFHPIIAARRESQSREVAQINSSFLRNAPEPAISPRDHQSADEHSGNPRATVNVLRLFRTSGSHFGTPIFD